MYMGAPVNDQKLQRLEKIIEGMNKRLEKVEAELQRRKGGRPKTNGAVTGEQAQVL
jgi:hypothetical protein